MGSTYPRLQEIGHNLKMDVSSVTVKGYIEWVEVQKPAWLFHWVDASLALHQVIL